MRNHKKIGKNFVISFASLLICTWSTAQQQTDVEAELLRNAQMWSAKNRPDMAVDLVDKLLSMNPNSPEGLMFSAELLLRDNKIAEARKILETLSAKHPKHAATRNLEILIRVSTTDKAKLAEMRLFTRAGRKDEAARVAQDLFADGAPTYGSLAQEYYQAMGTNAKTSQKVIDELGRRYRESGDPNYRLSQLEIQLNQGKIGPLELRELENLSNQVGIDPSKLKAIWANAIVQIGSAKLKVISARLFLKRFPGDPAMIERLAAAQKSIEQSERVANDPANIARNAARAALDSNDLELAESSLETVLQSYPNDAESVGNLGLVRLRQGRHDDAKQLFVRANQLSPQEKWMQLQTTAEFWGLLRKAGTSASEKNWTDATNYVQQAINMQPDNLQAMLTLAEIHALSGNTESAQSLYEKVIQKEPGNVSALKSLAILLSQNAQSERALALLAKASGISKELAAELLSAKADILQAQAESLIATDQDGPAIRALEAALLITPNNPWLRFKTAKLFQKLEQFPEASAVMDEGVKMAPQNPEMRYARALVRSSLDDDQGVLEDIQAVRASEQTPKMQALLERAKVGVAVSQAMTSTKQAEQAALLSSAESMAGNDPNLLLSVANAWLTLGQPLNGVAVFDGLQSRQPNLTPDVQLQHATVLNRALVDAPLAQMIPALMAISSWDTRQERQLIDLYTDYQSRRIEESLLAGNNQDARHLANLPIPGRHAENSGLRERASLQLLRAAQDHLQIAQVIRNALVTKPDDVGLHSELANALIKTGALSEAAVEVRWLSLRVSKNNINERLALIRLWQESKAFDQARQEFDVLLAQFPDNLDVLLSAGRFEQNQKQYKAALALFRRARDVELSRAPSVKTVETQANNAVKSPGPQVGSTSDISPLASEIQLGINLIEERQLSWVEVGQRRLQKNSTNGISTLNGLERTALFSFPDAGDGRIFFQVDQVDLDAGDISAVNTINENFGQLPASSVTAFPNDVLAQNARGFNLGAGYERDGLRFDFGFIGVGLPVTNVVGGVSHSFNVGPYSLSVDLSRRALTGSLLSYAGAIDPVSRQTWGGVVATGIGGRIATDIGDYSVSASVDYAVLTGENVEDNTRMRFRLAADREIFTSANQRVNLGLALSAWRYAKDLSEFTWGHGGYYSPQRYLSLSAPLEWTGNDGALSWLLRGTASISRSTSNASDYFPTNSVLQSLAQSRQNAVYAGSESSGTGYSLRGVLEYKIAPTTSVGAQLEIDRSDYYSPTSLFLYARHYFGDVMLPASKKPKPVGTYSSF